MKIERTERNSQWGLKKIKFSKKIKRFFCNEKKRKSMAEARMLRKVSRRQERPNAKGLLSYDKDFKLSDIFRVTV